LEKDGDVSDSTSWPRLRLDPAVADRFPTYSGLIVYAFGLANGPSDAASVARLRAAEATARLAFADQRPADHPHVAAWRRAYAAFGAKPSKYPCSVEALAGRTVKGQDLPAINRVVDLYNAISLRHVLPVGGEDLDALDGDLILTFATGDEQFDLPDGDAPTSHPEPGEVVWADRAGVTCRRWNWRQGRRTRLTETSRNAYFVLDRLEPFSLEALQASADELIELMRGASPGATFDSELLGATA
jgi:DNA/RNA-binding domain of Phe-tRNA-synthetase-like protein